MKQPKPKSYQHHGQSLERLRRVAEVIWSHRGEQTILEADFISMGTTGNYCPTHLRVNSVEAESAIRILEEAKLIFPVKHPNADRTCYLVHELKEREWTEFLDRLPPAHRHNSA